MKNQKRFMYAFKINKMIIFEVEYGAIKENKNWHFSTSSAEFIRSKKDFARCGQCQNDLLKNNKIAFDFFSKWDNFHLSNLTTKQYKNLLKDIEILKNNYKYIFKDENYDRHYIPFYELKDLSMEV